MAQLRSASRPAPALDVHRTCRRCGHEVPPEATHLVPLHEGRHGVACPGSGTKPLVTRAA